MNKRLSVYVCPKCGQLLLREGAKPKIISICGNTDYLFAVLKRLGYL